MDCFLTVQTAYNEHTGLESTKTCRLINDVSSGRCEMMFNNVRHLDRSTAPDRSNHISSITQKQCYTLALMRVSRQHALPPSSRGQINTREAANVIELFAFDQITADQKSLEDY